MNAQGHIIVPLERKGKDGKDAVNIQPSTDNLVYAEGDRIKAINIFAYRGSERVTLSDDNWGGMTGLKGLTSGVEASGGIITLSLTRLDLTADINGTITYYIIIDGTTYEKSCHVECVFNGEDGATGPQGPQGEPGEDAIYYELELSSESLDYNAFADAFAPSTITVQVLKVEGTTRSYVSFNGFIYFMDGDTTNGVITILSQTSYTFEPKARGGWSSVITTDTPYNTHFSLRFVPTENGAVSLTKTIYPTTSYYPRVRYWEDVADGGQFCQGKLGEQYRDIVIHPKSSNSYFYCKVSHTKSSDKTPVGDNTDQYWAGVSYYESIATGLLLADLAKVNNLYVDDVFMVRENTAIWIDPLNEGMKINSASKLGDRKDISEQEAEDWANPTTWFHGAPVPTVSQIYGKTTVSTTSRTISAGRMYINSANNAVRVDSSIYATTSALVTALPVGRTLMLKNTTAIEKAFRMVEGKYTTTSFGLTQSSAQIWLYKIVDGVQSKLIQLSVIYGAGQDNEEGETYLKCPTFSLTHTNVGTSAQQVQVALGFEGGQFMAGAELYLYESITITPSVSMLTEGYVSQFGADGIFLGYDSYNYLMHKLSESLTQHTMLANNTGIDISQQGSMQVVGGNQMPLGGCLALVNITVSAGLASFDVWTFDGASLSGQYYGTGIYRVFFPSSWADKFGSFDMYKMVVTTSYRSNGSTIGVSVWEGTYSGYWGYLNIHVVNGTTYTDVPVSLRIDYMSNVTSREMSQSTSAITPLSIIQDAEIINE